MKSEMDAQRELLDSLMGINRNNDRKADHVSDFRDDRVCKFYLAGMCPHDMFVNTKMDEGPCPKLHTEQLKMAFEQNGDLYMYDHIIEKEFTARLNEADRIIKRARARVEDDKVDEEINPDVNPDIIRIHGDMSKLIQEAEAAGEVGDIDRVQDLVLIRLEELTKEKQAVMNRINETRKQRLSGPDKKLRVCDVCGSFLSIFDSDKRLGDHFLGKQHIGFQYMRDTLEAIKKRRDERRSSSTSNQGSSTRDNNHNSNNSSNNRDNRKRSRSPDTRRHNSRDGHYRDRDRYAGSNSYSHRNRDRGDSRERRRQRSRSR
jgi:hypothetical protein